MPEFEESDQKDVVPMSDAKVEKSPDVTNASNDDVVENKQSDVVNDTASAEKPSDGNTQNGRYLLKRGRLPQSKSSAAVEKRTSANVVDVEHDAIGIRADNTPKRPMPVKKTTRVVDDEAKKTNGQSKKRQQTNRSKDNASKQVANKPVEKQSSQKECKCCGLKGLLKKIIEFFSGKEQQPTKNRFAHENKQRGQQSKRHGNNKSHHRRQNNSKKSV